MKKFLMLVLGLSVAIATAAQDSKRESVEELLRIMKVDSMIDGIYTQMDQAFLGMGQQLGVKESEQAIFDQYMKKVFAVIREDITWEKMKEPMIGIYLAHYSEQEIQDMLTFYNSATGRSMVDKMPAVMNDSMELSQEIMRSSLPRIQVLAQELQRELAEHRQSQQ